MHILRENEEKCIFLTSFTPMLDCAQIVPVKVKYFQIFQNETKSYLKKLNRISWLEL